MNGRKIHIGLVDNDAFVVRSLTRFLTRVGCDVVFTCTDADQAWNDARSPESAVDILLIDIQLDETTGFALTRRIRLVDPHTPIVLFTAFELSRFALRAVQCGAQALTGKDDPLCLVRLLYRICQGQTGPDINGISFDSPRQAFERLSKSGQTGFDALSPTERHIARLCSTGETTAEIAHRLGISSESVKTYLKRAYEKTGCRDRTAFVAGWVRYEAGLI
jgi:two-component system nitrate/nitrite response regulator NarL